MLLRYSGSLVVAVEVYIILTLVDQVVVMVDLTLQRDMVLKVRPTVP